MKLGLFGFPISHSKSPRLFARLSRLIKRPISYEAVLAAPGTLAAFAAGARDRGWRGANVTVPLKEEAASISHRLTPAAKALGAVNVLRFGRTIIGHNTDAEGLRDAMKRSGVKAKNKSALVFGAGGAARAAGWALAREGAKSVRFCARTQSRARKSAKDLAVHFPRIHVSAGAAAPADIWVNATPLGMKGFPDRTPAPKSLPSPSTAVDLVYGRKTAFQRDAARRGAKVSDGSAMLVYQALHAWEFWDKPLGRSRRAKLAERLIHEVIS
ncbi:MAG: shikimate dehydrogenase [Elusimicrobia bacterium]|nr:shikimate dehydrogenase [Elusimicrobiota bacterium]